MANKANSVQATTAQRLSSIIKLCRDIMRKDKGLNRDLDRLPIPSTSQFALDMLKVPLSNLGTIRKIARLFGGTDHLKSAVEQV